MTIYHTKPFEYDRYRLQRTYDSKTRLYGITLYTKDGLRLLSETRVEQILARGAAPEKAR